MAPDSMPGVRRRELPQSAGLIDIHGQGEKLHGFVDDDLGVGVLGQIDLQRRASWWSRLRVNLICESRAWVERVAEFVVHLNRAG